MSVSTFTQTDFTAQDGTTYKTAIDNAINVLKRLGASFAPHQSLPAAMNVVLDVGYIWNGATVTTIAPQTSATITAPVGNPRIDRVVYDSASGAVSVVTGTPAASPVAPAIPTGKLPACQVLLQTTSTTITNSMVTDERVIGTGNLFSQSVRVAGTASAAGQLILAENTANGTDTVTLIAPTAMASSKTQTMQDVTGTVLSTNGIDVPIADGGTGASTALAGFNNIKQSSAIGYEGVVGRTNTAGVQAGTSQSEFVSPANLRAALGFSKYFDTGGITITANTANTFAHGFAGLPLFGQLFLRCITAEFSYNVGDEIPFSHREPANNNGYNLAWDATNVIVLIGSNGGQLGISITRKDTRAGQIITLANWNLFARLFG